MSVDLYVRLERSRMPTPRLWQDALTDLGFGLKIDTEFDVVDYSGHLWCDYGEKPAGFEYHYELLDVKTLKKKGLPPGEVIQISLVTHSDEMEFLGSAIAAAALASVSDGTVEDPQEGNIMSAAEAVGWAKELEEAILAEPRTEWPPLLPPLWEGTERIRWFRRRPWWKTLWKKMQKVMKRKPKIT